MTDLTYNEQTMSMDIDLRDTWWTPDGLTDEENDSVCEMLEALFALPEAEEKRDYPHELSVLIKSNFGVDRLAYIVNGGDGSLLTAFDPAFCFGIEGDDKRSRKRKGRYQNIGGEISKVSMLMEPLTRVGDVIVDLRPDVSVDDTLDFLNVNWDEQALAILIDHGKANWERLIATPGVYAMLNLTDLDLQVYFLCDPGYRKEIGSGVEDGETVMVPTDIISRDGTSDLLDLLGQWLQEAKNAGVGQMYSRRRTTHTATAQLASWKAIHREYGRRYLKDSVVYDVELFGKTKINYMPSDWAKLAIENTAGHLGNIATWLHQSETTYFASASGRWRELMILHGEGILLIDPKVIEAVVPVIEDAERALTPLRPLKPVEKLGYLNRQSKIKCLKDDEERGFVKGKWYSVSLQPMSYDKKFTKTETVKNVLQSMRKKRTYWHQMIRIDGFHNFYDDDPQNIRYLLEHFEMPDPGDVESRYPEDFEAEVARYKEIEKEYLVPRGKQFKPYQLRDLAALSIATRNINAHEQGMGKSIQGLAFAINAAKKEKKDLPVLFVVPQDLIPQWQKEAKDFYGIELKWIGRHKSTKGAKEVQAADQDTVTISGGAIKNMIEAREVDQHVRAGGSGYWITHYECLTTGGARNLRVIEEPYTIRIEVDEKWVKGGYRTDKATGKRTWFDGENQTKEREVTTAHECPECGNRFLFGAVTCNNRIPRWDGDDKGRVCGWTRIVYKLPTIGQILSTTFKKGVIVVDEGTQIASARGSNEITSSQKTKALVGMKAKYRLLMSGTPIKNFIAQAYWLLWWAVGGKERDPATGKTRWNPRFPYAYRGGKDRFADEYTVVETTYNEDTGNWNNPKEVGEVTNHTQLWAQLASVIMRRVKEETGELIPKKLVHEIYAPLGYRQREQMDFWFTNFPAFFAEKYPNDPKVKKGTHKGMASVLGLDHKLNYASVLPKSDPDWEWTNVPVSNYTPAAYRALVTIMSLIKQDRHVLVGTDIKRVSGWLSTQLAEKGVRTQTMLDSQGQTLAPPDRSKVVTLFQSGALDALVSTQKAIRLGHNLDKGSAVVLFGLDWDYETYSQFTQRVHRLTTTRPVDIYVIISGQEGQTILAKKWDRIQDKQKGASMALDGYIPEQNEEPPDIGEIMRQMIENGIPATGKEVMEAKVEEAWSKVPLIEDFVLKPDFEENQAKPWVIDWQAANDCLAEYLEVKAAWEAEEQEIADAEMYDMAFMLKDIVDTAVCDSLEAFFAGATAPLPEPVEENVTSVTNSFESVVGPEITESEETSSVGDDSDESTARDAAPADSEDVAPSSEGSTPVSEPVIPDAVGTNGEEPGDTVETPVTSPAPSVDFMGQLKEAKELLDMQILTQAEFDEIKATCLAGLKNAAGVA